MTVDQFLRTELLQVTAHETFPLEFSKWYVTIRQRELYDLYDEHMQLLFIPNGVWS